MACSVVSCHGEALGLPLIATGAGTRPLENRREVRKVYGPVRSVSI